MKDIIKEKTNINDSLHPLPINTYTPTPIMLIIALIIVSLRTRCLSINKNGSFDAVLSSSYKYLYSQTKLVIMLYVIKNNTVSMPSTFARKPNSIMEIKIKKILDGRCK